MNMITYNGRPDLQRFNAEWQIHQQPNFAATPIPHNGVSIQFPDSGFHLGGDISSA